MSEVSLNVESNSLTIKQVFNAPIARSFDCFTQPELLSQWHAPSDTMTTSAEVSLRVGGNCRIAMTDSDGKVHAAIGTFQEIDEPDKLVYSWRWENGEGPDTLITVLFKEVGTKTEVELIHTGFTAGEEAQHHSQGWQGIFGRLDGFLNLA
jgi:uncharacterized protein YndB with AHSA1/START domain